MRRRVLLLLKPLDVYPPRLRPKTDSLPATITTSFSSSTSTPQRNTSIKILRYLDDRCKVHKQTINLCKDVLQRKSIDWKILMRNDLSELVSDVDLVITVGGDGTLLQASHFMDDSIPILGVNSDPTQVDEVEEFSNEYDATRSTGYLCAATAENFESVLDEVLQERWDPSELSRIALRLNGHLLPTYALNDVLVAHPCPASVSRFSFRIMNNSSSLVNCRSSGLRICTAAGSTAAMQSAGGFPMPILCHDIQYMVREPISTDGADSSIMHGLMKRDQSILVSWYSKEGFIYIDGSHVFHSIQHGDTLEISSTAPVLKVHLPSNLQLSNCSSNNKAIIE